MQTAAGARRIDGVEPEPGAHHRLRADARHRELEVRPREGRGIDEQRRRRAEVSGPRVLEDVGVGADRNRERRLRRWWWRRRRCHGRGHAGGGAGVGERLTGNRQEPPVVAPGVQRQLEQAEGAVLDLAVGADRPETFLFLAAGPDHERPDAAGSVEDADRRLRRESLVVVVVPASTRSASVS